jgi:hypothetical protein
MTRGDDENGPEQDLALLVNRIWRIPFDIEYIEKEMVVPKIFVPEAVDQLLMDMDIAKLPLGTRRTGAGPRSGQLEIISLLEIQQEDRVVRIIVLRNHARKARS